MRDREKLLEIVARYRQLASDAAAEAAGSQYAAWRDACCKIADHWQELADDIDAFADLRTSSIVQSD